MWPGIEDCRITDERTAAILVKGLEGAGRCLDDALQEIIAYETPAERKLAVHAVATVTGTAMDDLLMSLLTQHPDLDKHGLLSPAGQERTAQDG